MAPSVSNVEALIGKATNTTSFNEDPNVMQKICQAVVTEPLGMQTAIRLIAHKMQSPQECEAMQSLLILQSCVNNCGKAFHTEVGKFRFLNEMIKIVSPNYLGNHRPLHIKSRICQLFYTWTIDLPHEPKIADAYQMLKTQKIIQEDPIYLGVTLPSGENKTQIIFKDAEKSKHLQVLLQSKKPEDVLEANALIKKIVRDDDRKMERSARRCIEVETALNNSSVLDAMISQYQRKRGGRADLDLMGELNESCSSIQTGIYRLVADLDDKEEGIGELLRANDELSRVMGRYKLIMKEPSAGDKGTTASPPVDLPLVENSPPIVEDSLLDLTPHPVSQTTDCATEADLESIAISTTDKESTAEMETKADLISILDESPVMEAVSSVPLVPSDTSNCFLPELLIPEKHFQSLIAVEADDDILKLAKPLHSIDLLGSSIIRQHLPANAAPLGAQFRTKEKVSLNQLKKSQRTECATSYGTQVGGSQSVALELCPDQIPTRSTPITDMTNSISSAENKCDSSVANHDTSADLLNGQPISVPAAAARTNSNGLAEETKLDRIQPPKCISGDMKLSDILPDSSKPPAEIISRNLMKLSVHHTLNRSGDDETVFVITTSSAHSATVSNYNLHVIPPEGCSIRLLDPSATTFSPMSPFMPSPVVTQILIFSNPNQVTDDALRLILKYRVNGKTEADYGEFDLTAS